MQILGLTGGVASGKSTACQIFKENNVPVIDCDALVHKVQSENAELVATLKQWVPDAYETGTINRHILSHHVMNDLDLLKRVEHLTIPYVLAEIKGLIEKYKHQGQPVIVLDAPLLFETNLHELCQKTICVYVSEEVQKQRFLARSGMNEEKWHLIKAKQRPVAELKKRCDYHFHSQDIDSLRDNIHTLLHPYQETKKVEIGFYAGSFDPVTKGHFAMICEALRHYDKVIVGVGINDTKRALFTPQERVCMVQGAIEDLKKAYRYRALNGRFFDSAEKQVLEKITKYPDCIQVVSYSGLTVDAALKQGATVLLRGERNEQDHAYESALTTMNQTLLSVRKSSLGFATITPPAWQTLSHISSSSVKGFCAVGEYVAAAAYVSSTAHIKLMEKYLADVFEKTMQTFSSLTQKDIQSEYDRIVLALKQRAWHNLSYVGMCLNYLRIYETLAQEFDAEGQGALILACFYQHGIALPDGIDETIARQIKQNIAAVEQGGVLVTLAEQVMADINRAVLGSDRYGDYRQKIREEAGAMDEETFKAQRINTLKTWLDAPSIYQTAFFKEYFEEPAFEQISKEYKELKLNG